MGLSHGGEEDPHYKRGSQDFVSHHKPGLYDGIDGGSGSYPGSSGRDDYFGKLFGYVCLCLFSIMLWAIYNRPATTNEFVIYGKALLMWLR